jgi:hypothetical protein
MRELTKSTLSAGLAMSLFGMQTMMNVFRRSRDGGPNPARKALDTVTQAMVDQTGNTLRETFHVGDKVQREMVDLTFRFMIFAPMGRGNGMSTMTNVAQQATDRLRKMMGDMGGARQADCGCRGPAPPSSGTRTTPPPRSRAASSPGQGWGPMPDPPQSRAASPPGQGWGPMPDES